MNIDNKRQIIIVKNIVFKDLKDNRIILNNDIHYKRPCLIISEIDDRRYMLPISSSIRNEKYKNENIKIGNYDLLNRTLKTKKCYIKLDKILKSDIYYREPVDELDEIKYYKCLIKLIKYYENLQIKINEYEEIKDDLKDQLQKIKIKEKISI